MEINELLKLMVNKGASDLHLTVPSPPVFCIAGERIAAFEIMLASNTIRKYIKEGKGFEIPVTMEVGTPEEMQTPDQALASSVKRKISAQEDASLKSSDPAKLQNLLQSQDEATMLQGTIRSSRRK